MASELLVGEQLSEDMIRSGGALLLALDKLNVITKAAFWLLSPGERTWRYVLVSPEVRTVGPKALYRKVTTASKRLPADVKHLPTTDVAALDDRAELYMLLRTAIATGPTGVNGIRFTQNVINGHKIDDAYIYRMT